MLETLGLIFIALIVLVGFFVVRTVRRKQADRPQDDALDTLIDVLPPVFLELDESSRDRWHNTDTLDAYENLLKRAGFESHGYFTSYAAMADIEVSLWNHPQKGFVLAFMELSLDEVKNPDVLTDVFVRFEDGSSLTVSNAPNEHPLPRPENSRLVHESSRKIQDLFAAVKAHIPEGRKIKAVKQAKPYYQQHFEHYSAWLWQETQLRSPEVKALASTLGITLDDELIEELVAHGRTQRSDLKSQSIVDAFARQTSMSESQWASVCDRLVVVHDEMGANEIADCCYDLFDEVDEALAEALDRLANAEVLQDPLSKFHDLMSGHALAESLRRVANINKPIRAEIYLAAES
jgi:hypothetical protein